MNSPVRADDIMRQAAVRGGASQATSIEQSRAVAEVQAAVMVAQKCPRDETAALSKAMQSCKTWEVAESAFFKFPRGGESVSGETIHLAVELARCWGNVSYGIMELDRDDLRAQSEMLAFAWDLETNTQSRMTFIVPHRRDTRSGAKALVDMRDIYENNANNGARRLRECIFRVLPAWLKENAKAACHDTLQKGVGDKPVSVQVAEMIAAFEKVGISRARVEAKVGTIAKLTAPDLANLRVSFRSISRNEVSADDEFPRVGTEQATEAARKVAQKSKAPKDEKAAGPEQGRDDADIGELTTLDGAKAEIDACGINVPDLNSRTAAILPLLSDEDAMELRAYAVERINAAKEAAK